jgi:hypothetical protein
MGAMQCAGEHEMPTKDAAVHHVQAVMEVIRSSDTSAGVVDVEVEEVEAEDGEEEEGDAAAATAAAATAAANTGSSSSQQQNGTAHVQANGVQPPPPQQDQPPPNGQQQQAASTQGTSQEADALAESAAEKLTV